MIGDGEPVERPHTAPELAAAELPEARPPAHGPFAAPKAGGDVGDVKLIGGGMGQACADGAGTREILAALGPGRPGSRTGVLADLAALGHGEPRETEMAEFRDDLPAHGVERGDLVLIEQRQQRRRLLRGRVHSRADDHRVTADRPGAASRATPAVRQPRTVTSMHEQLQPPRRRMLRRAEVESLAAGIRRLLTESADLSHDSRSRWEGALTMCEVIAGRAPSLVDDEIAALVRTLL